MKITLHHRDGRPRGTIEVVDGELVLGGDVEFVRDLAVVEPDSVPARLMSPAEGDAYLRAMLYEFRSPYMQVTVEENAPAA